MTDARSGRTFVMRVRPPSTMRAAGAPPSASARQYLRGGLPAIYEDDDFGLRFLGALEALLDPIVALLDCESALFTPELAPRDVLELMAAWLGVELDRGLPDEGARSAVRNAAELSRRRGTRMGVELALRTRFPDLPLRVEDGGAVTWSASPAPPGEAPKPATFVVYCDEQVAEERLQSVLAVIDRVRPVHATYRLRVRQPRRPAASKDDE
jgi:phage tail-like protein